MSYEPIDVAEGKASFVWPHSSSIDIRPLAGEFGVVVVDINGLYSELSAVEAEIIGSRLRKAAHATGGAV